MTIASTAIILGREERLLELFVGWLIVSVGAKEGFFRRECTLAGPVQRIRVNLEKCPRDFAKTQLSSTPGVRGVNSETHLLKEASTHITDNETTQ